MFAPVPGFAADFIARRASVSRIAWTAALLIGLAGTAAYAVPACDAPVPVCSAREAVFAVSGFDPYGSAVRIGSDLLVTNRHIVADEASATLRLPDGGTVQAEVLPTAFAGDLVLLRATLPPGPALDPGGELRGDLYTVAQDIGSRTIRAFPKGEVLFKPEPGKPMARLHHTAYSQPGTSGGALVDAGGAFVGVVTSGGEGRYEAIPAARIASLKQQSGPAFADESAKIGDAYRDCTLSMEEAGRDARLDDGMASRIADRCTATGNRQMFDLAAQVLGRARRLDESAALFERGLEMDPNAINTRLGLVVTLVFARRHADAVPHVRRLVEILPEEPQVHQYAVQVGKLGNAPDLTEKGLALIAKYNPAKLDSAKRFLEMPMPPARR